MAVMDIRLHLKAKRGEAGQAQDAENFNKGNFPGDYVEEPYCRDFKGLN